MNLTSLPLWRVAPAVTLLLSACTKPEPRGNPPSHNGAAASPASATASVSSPLAPQDPSPGPREWVEAVRFEDWSEAAKLLDELPEEKKKQPEIQYVRARVALAQRDWKRALSLLDGLEQRLGTFASDIGMHRAEAQLHGGQDEEAARYFARQSSVKALTKAALAWSRAGNRTQARATIDRAIRIAKKRTGDDVVEARRVRAQLAEASADRATAVADLRFVARHATDSTTVDDASVRLLTLDPKLRLTAEDHMDRAMNHAARGHSSRTDEEIERAIRAPGGPPSQVDQLLARGRALYNSREDYGKAAQVYEQASQIRGAHVPQALYFAAKAWSRANDNDRGLELYGKLIRQHPDSTWAERASYFAPRLHRFQARWPLAEKGFAAYLKRHPRGMFVKEARYELALCLLLSGRHKDARRAFEQLGREEREAFNANSYRYLAAVAAHGEGKVEEAAEIWRQLIATQPLSFFALTSAARLASIGQSPPPPIAPGPAGGSRPVDVKLPHAVLLLRDIGLDRDAEEHLRAMETTLETAWGDRGGEALCNAYGQLRTGARLHRIGQRHAPVRLVQMSPSIATRWAWDCLYPKPYASEIGRLEQRENLPQGLIHAVIRQESAFQPDALSPVGARGLMQLMPQTAAKTSQRMSRPHDPETITAPGVNLTLGTHYLGMLMRMMNDSVPLAVGAYNAGPSAVGRWVARTEDVPVDVWVALVPYQETRHYIWRVIGNWARYRYLELGESGIPVINLRIPPGISVPDDAY
jgi:soluble lytic murein transglycosylase